MTVNILTNHAVNRGRITVFGGAQYRPNLHIQDMTDLYLKLLALPRNKIADKIFNAGYQNQTVLDIAHIVKSSVEAQGLAKGEIGVEITPSDDIRSYRITCDKIENEIGFRPRYTIENAVNELCAAFKAGKVPNPLDDANYIRAPRRIPYFSGSSTFEVDSERYVQA